MVSGCGHDEIKYIPGDLEQPEGNGTYPSTYPVHPYLELKWGGKYEE